MTDIAERLRALVILDEVGSDNPLGREAADEIERLRAEVERLRRTGSRPLRYASRSFLMSMRRR